MPVVGESTVLPRVERTHKPKKQGVRERLTVDGRERTYLLLPAPSSQKRLPLVLVFHGDGGDAKGLHDAWPFEVASGDDAFVAYLDGLGSTWDLESVIANHDVAFVEALVDDLARRLPIDRARVFLTGYSSGGFFSNVVACQKSGLVRAIASNAGGAPFKQGMVWSNGYSRCPGQSKVPMLALHGTMDLGVTVDSGRFSAAYWAYVNGCKETEQETTGYAECRMYRGCERPVGYCEIPTLGHWVWDQAAEVSWTFFSRT